LDGGFAHSLVRDNGGAKAAVNRTHSKRWRECRTPIAAPAVFCSLRSQFQNSVAADVSRRKLKEMARTHVRGYRVLKAPFRNPGGSRFVPVRHPWFAVFAAILLTPSLRADTLRLLVPSGYLPSVPALVRVEILNADGTKNRDLWDAEVELRADVPGVLLSTNRVQLKNGLGSALVTFAGGSDFNLTASLGDLEATRTLMVLSTAPVTTLGGTLPASNVIWSGVVRVTNDVTVPVGGTLTIEPGTLVLLNGVSSGTTAPDLFINGTIQSLGTETQPVTITCANAAQRWGQIRHSTAQPSLCRYTTITRGGRATGEGHTGTGPVIRTSGSQIAFEHCSLTDHAEPGGTPGKVMYATGSVLSFNDCLLARSRMGPEVASSAIVCSNTWFLDMRGPDDSDGIYIHTQNPGQLALLSGCVLAGGDDDALDTLGSDVTLEDCLIRDWTNPSEDAKGISVFHGETTVRRSVIVNCYVGVSAKSSGPPARVNLLNSTITGLTRGIAATFKANATVGNILFSVTNCILRSVDAVYTDFGATNFNIGYCNLSGPWPGTGNFTADPLFEDAGTNFHLHGTSPCLDAGDPGVPPDADGTRADVGAFVYLQNRDGDGDGLPDLWEDTRGLNKFLDDAGLDPDRDGLNNGQEFLAGTDPQNAASGLRVQSATPGDTGTEIRFEAVAGRSYSILCATNLAVGSWLRLPDVPPQTTTHIFTVHDPAGATGSRFYRVVTPALP
jgi:hypothetical protein